MYKRGKTMGATVSISSELKELWPMTVLGILEYTASVERSDISLLSAFDGTVTELSAAYTLESIGENPHIAATRSAYKAFGKSSHEYRNAAEAMLRRVAKGNGLYHINNVVEINNLISISSGYSIGSYDAAQLVGPIELRIAPEGVHYDGIGKSSVNIGRLPVLYDTAGAFGNPSSDSQRAMIKPGKRNVMSVIYSFDGTEELKHWMERYAEELHRHLRITSIESYIV